MKRICKGAHYLPSGFFDLSPEGDTMDTSKPFLLEVPVDASQVADLKPNQAVKVVAYPRQGKTLERLASLNADGSGVVSFRFDEAPGAVKVALGPETASATDLKNLQTINVTVPAAAWRETSEVRLPVVSISPYYWRWWLHWCRNFKVTGRILCADGSPVVGATVSAFDVDAWWWWFSQELVGTAVTDASGSFQIDFTRCCGWWPWFWWDLREWQVDPILVEKISALVKQNPKLGRLPSATAEPSLEVFQKLLASSVKTKRVDIQTSVARPAAHLEDAALDPNALEALRGQLSEVLPREFPLPIWPWYPWYPWLECGTNLIFKATQVCNGQTKTIVAQTVFETQWDVATNYNVTLNANDLACCAYTCGSNGGDCPEGNCIVPSDICDINVGSIGGNVGAPATVNPGQVGLYLPGVQDRPFGGAVDIFGTFGDLVNVDYYEFEYATAPGGPYVPLPLAAAGGFDRQVLTVLPGPIFKWVPVPFPVTTISDGAINHNVIETIAHYESINGSQEWDAATHDLMIVLQSLNTLPNGTYYLRVVSYVRPGTTGTLALADTGNPGNPGILPICDPFPRDPKLNNWWVLTLDNQAPLPTDPSGQPCGVHICTDQPTSDILQLAILHNDGSSTVIEGCQTFTINCTDQLQIDYVAYDPDGFLDYYELQTFYGVDLSVDLLSVPATIFGPSPLAPSWAPAAAQVGATYGDALTEGATSPVWSGGSMRLTVSATAAFPVTCAYLLQLSVYKRTIVDCDGDDPQQNVSYESFTINVNCPAS
jgi:hypothetical protein